MTEDEDPFADVDSAAGIEGGERGGGGTPLDGPASGADDRTAPECSGRRVVDIGPYLCGRKTLTMPSEIAVGALDRFSQGTTPNRLTVLDEYGHVLFSEYPEPFARRVRDRFLHGSA